MDRKTLVEGIDDGRELLAAYPLVNSPLLVPGAAERNTTIVTYLFTDPTANIFAQQGTAYRYAEQIDQPATRSSASRARYPLRSSRAAWSERRCPPSKPSHC